MQNVTKQRKISYCWPIKSLKAFRRLKWWREKEMLTFFAHNSIPTKNYQKFYKFNKETVLHNLSCAAVSKIVDSRGRVLGIGQDRMEAECQVALNGPPSPGTECQHYQGCSFTLLGARARKREKICPLQCTLKFIGR